MTTNDHSVFVAAAWETQAKSLQQQYQTLVLAY